MGHEFWAELFFADDKGAVCAVLFHGYSVESLYRLSEPLFYDDLTLADVAVKVTAEKKQTAKDGKTATYYIAQFGYEAADPAEVAARRDLVRDSCLARRNLHRRGGGAHPARLHRAPRGRPAGPRAGRRAHRLAAGRLVSGPHGARRGAPGRLIISTLFPMNHPTERPQLSLEQPARDEAEAAVLAQLAELLANSDLLPDLRDFAPAVRQLFPEPAYLVGCGSAHTWLHRAADPQRLALIR